MHLKKITCKEHFTKDETLRPTKEQKILPNVIKVVISETTMTPKHMHRWIDRIV